VLDSFPPARGRRTAARIQLLRALETGAPADALQAMLQTSTSGVDLRRFALNWNLHENEARALWLTLPMRKVEEAETAIGFSPATWQALGQRLLNALMAEHARVPDMLGVDRERLRRMTAPTLPRTAFLALTDELLATDDLHASGLWLHLPGHSVTLSAHEEKCWIKVRPQLDAAPYQPPRVRDIARDLDMDERTLRLTMQHLARLGEVFQVAHDHFFTREAVAAMATIARKLADDNALEAASFRDHLGVGRKLAIQILEFFDRVGYTRRARDRHALRYAELFADAAALTVA